LRSRRANVASLADRAPDFGPATCWNIQEQRHAIPTRCRCTARSTPIRLHVAAKRYLCATDSEYIGRLSRPSLDSLALQGGPMSPAEVAAFERLPKWDHAVLLRAWDDEAKVPGLEVPPLSSYRGRMERAMRDPVRE
jgi:predicted HD phosphohydrolase